jgi:hypothetical protein
MGLVVQKGDMVVLGSLLGNQEVRGKGPYHYALPGRNFSVGYCLQAHQEDLHRVAHQHCAVSLLVIAVDASQVPLVAQLQVPAVLVLESFASVYEKLSCTFLSLFIEDVDLQEVPHHYRYMSCFKL